MGGKCGGPPMRERAENKMKQLYRMRQRNRVKSPFDCPVCFEPDALRVIRTASKEDWRIRIFNSRCGKCGITHSTSSNKLSFEVVDAFCELVDSLNGELLKGGI